MPNQLPVVPGQIVIPQAAAILMCLKRPFGPGRARDHSGDQSPPVGPSSGHDLEARRGGHLERAVGQERVIAAHAGAPGHESQPSGLYV